MIYIINRQLLKMGVHHDCRVCKQLWEFEQQVQKVKRKTCADLCKTSTKSTKAKPVQKYKSKTCAERGDLALAPLPGSKPERSQTRWRHVRC